MSREKTKVGQGVGDETLAIDGGVPVRREPLPPCLPGGLAIGEEEKAEVLEVIEAQSPYRYYGTKPLGKVKAFEREFAEKIGKRHALAVSSGTAALRVALAALGVGPRDEVIIPAVTFLGSVGATVMSRAIPIFAEIDHSFNLDPDDFEAKITGRTKVVMPVPIQGVPCKMDAIMEIAQQRGIKVLEDCAQSCGASFEGKMVGSLGDINAFSLQYNKVITSGEGGVVVTDDDELFERAIRAHDHGVIRPETGQILNLYQDEAFIGENFRMSELAGAMARAQLRKLDRIVATLRPMRQRIQEALSDLDRLEFREIPGGEGDVGFTLVFFLPTKEQAGWYIKALCTENVDVYQIYGGDPVYAYPQVLNQAVATDYDSPFDSPLSEKKVQYHMGMCPRSEDLLTRSVWIPISTALRSEDVDDIIRAVRKVHRALK